MAFTREGTFLAIALKSSSLLDESKMDLTFDFAASVDGNVRLTDVCIVLGLDSLAAIKGTVFAISTIFFVSAASTTGGFTEGGKSLDASAVFG